MSRIPVTDDSSRTSEPALAFESSGGFNWTFRNRPCKFPPIHAPTPRLAARNRPASKRSPVAALFVCQLIAPLAAVAQTYGISTFAGGALNVNIPASTASLYGPQSAMAVDPSGNVYFADGDTILRLDAITGVVTLVAGNGTAGYSGDNGPAIDAQLSGPYGLALDSSGNLYIGSLYNNVVRKVAGGVITTVVGTGVAGFSGDGGPAASAQLNAPYALAVDSSGNLFISDSGNSRIREVSSGVIATVAGNGTTGFAGDNGPAIGAQLSAPRGLALDIAGNLYIADSGNNRIREVSAGVIVTIAGTGVAGFGGDGGAALGAQLNLPCGIAFDSSGKLYIADYYNNRIRQISAGTIATVAGKGTPGFSGDNGAATSAQLNNPYALGADPAGNLYIADYGNDRIRKVAAGVITTAAGSGASGFSGDGGTAVGAQLDYPRGVAVDSSGNVYAADTANSRVRKIAGGVIATVAGNGTAGFAGDGGQAASAQLNQPGAVLVDASGNLYISDSGNNRIRKVSAAGVISTFAGNGTAGFGGDSGKATAAQLNQPAGMAFDSAGDLYIADLGNSRIRKISAAGTITTVAGNGIPGFTGDGGFAATAELDQPSAVAVDSTGILYIADTGNNRIRKVAGTTISTVAGTGVAGFSGDGAAATSAQLFAPAGVLVTAGGSVYVADTSNNCIRKITGGTISTIAGGGPSFGDNGPAISAELGGPRGMAFDSSGDLYVADTQDDRIRLLTPVPLGITAPLALPAGTVGVAYAAVAFTAAGGAGGYTWSATGLPKGMTISAAGSLSGTPTAASNSNVSFTVKDSSGATATTSLSLVVSVPTPTISSVSPTSVTAYGAALTLTVNGTNYTAGCAVEWNASPLVTKVVNATQMTAAVTASTIGGAGSASIVADCAGVTSAPFSLPINPQPPALTSLSPTSAPATSGAFTLTLNGSAFAMNDTVTWAGSPLPTTYVGPGQLTAFVAANLIATAGTASVLVTAGAASTSAITFTITAPPAITTLSPSSAVVGTGGFTLTVTGTGFAQGAVVQWNGNPLVTTFVSATQITAAVTSGLIANVGNPSVQVNVSGASSAGITFAIDAPPTVTTLSPASATSGGAAFTLTVTGTGFVSGMAVAWNGTALTTKFVSATQLTASVTAPLIASAGSASVTVTYSGSATSAVQFTINAPLVVTTLNPATVQGSGAAFTLTVNGTGFLTGAAVQWNTTALTTTFVSSTQLTAAVPANTAEGVGTASIVVMNPGGALSPAIKLPITAVAPVVAQGGIVPIDSTVSVIQPGSWVSIYGTGLASAVAVWTGNYPTTLGGTSVTVDGKAAFLWFVSPTQINFQAPNDTQTGTVNVVVKTANGSVTSQVTLAPYAPSLTLLPGGNYVAGVILTPDGTGAYGGGSYDLVGPTGAFAFKTRPVKVGETVVLYGVGFGPTNPAVSAGKIFNSTAPTTNPVTVTIGGVSAQVQFAGAVSSGVYQLNVVVPVVGSGAQAIVASAGGSQSPAANLITVQ